MFAFNVTKSVVRLAVDDVNNDPSILSGVTLSVSYNDSNRDPALAAAILLEKVNIPYPPKIGVLGERVSRVCLSLSYLASYYRLPQVAYGCTSQNLSNRSSTYVLRGTPTDLDQARALAALIGSFKFSGDAKTEVSTISSADEYGTSFQTVRTSLFMRLG